MLQLRFITHAAIALAAALGHRRLDQIPNRADEWIFAVFGGRQEGSSSREVRVWVNTSSRVYHCPGTKWYGITRTGQYLGEAEAVARQYRAAGGKSCTVLSGGKTDSVAATTRLRAGSRGSGRVWVNATSRVYHCPGSRWYGATARGAYVSEADAQKAGNRPANGRKCT